MFFRDMHMTAVHSRNATQFSTMGTVMPLGMRLNSPIPMYNHAFKKGFLRYLVWYILPLKRYTPLLSGEPNAPHCGGRFLLLQGTMTETNPF